MRQRVDLDMLGLIAATDQMLDSILLVGGRASGAMACFLTGLMGSLGHELDRPFFALALLAIPLLDGSGVTAYQ